MPLSWDAEGGVCEFAFVTRAFDRGAGPSTNFRCIWWALAGRTGSSPCASTTRTCLAQTARADVDGACERVDAAPSPAVVKRRLQLAVRLGLNNYLSSTDCEGLGRIRNRKQKNGDFSSFGSRLRIRAMWGTAALWAR